MTMGPEPMMRMDCMDVSLGMMIKVSGLRVSGLRVSSCRVKKMPETGSKNQIPA